jgi:alkanesulfonate monooxygenase SsuD/methylene tetrahydromethanopterin reductase-like flavin-dependent oxidoreductase (luciferase family)
MHYGVVMFPTDYAIRPDDLARATEGRGFESLWVPEHTHIPASRKSPWPGGGELPREYWSTYDPFIALGAAAAVTRRLKVATGICRVIERDPIITAKEVATLDRLSGGRFLLGLGMSGPQVVEGWYGQPYGKLLGRTREYVEIVRAIWRREKPLEYTGKHYQIPYRGSDATGRA